MNSANLQSFRELKRITSMDAEQLAQFICSLHFEDESIKEIYLSEILPQ